MSDDDGLEATVTICTRDGSPAVTGPRGCRVVVPASRRPTSEPERECARCSTDALAAGDAGFCRAPERRPLLGEAARVFGCGNAEVELPRTLICFPTTASVTCRVPASSFWPSAGTRG